MVKVRSSRRVAGLKPNDYDHEIGLVNDERVENIPDSATQSAADTRRASTASPLVSSAEESEQSQRQASGSSDPQENTNPCHGQDDAPRPALSRQETCLASQDPLPHPAMQPSIEVQGKPAAALTLAQRICVYVLFYTAHPDHELTEYL